MIAVVEWGDAYIDTKDFTRKKAKTFKAIRRSSVGFLVAENDEGIVLATDKFKKKKDGYSAPMFIPWGMVINYYHLEDNDD